MKDIKLYLAIAGFYAALAGGPGVQSVRDVAYREYQISRAPIQANYTIAEGRTWTFEHPYSLVGNMFKGGAFDRDGDGNYDEVIERGGIVFRLGGIPTSRVLHPGDEKFQERLELIQRKSQDD